MLFSAFANINNAQAITLEEIKAQLDIVAVKIKQLQIDIITTKIKELQIQLDNLLKTTESVSKNQEKSISLTSPDGKEKLTVNQDYSITWNVTGYSSDAKVKINLLDDRYNQNNIYYTVLITETKNTGTYQWKIPDVLNFQQVYGALYKIAVTIEENGEQKSDQSDNYFLIHNPSVTPRLNIITPDGGESLYDNIIYVVKWDAGGLENYKVDIVLKRNNIVQLAIANKLENTNHYEWQVPSSLNGTSYKISISLYDQYGSLIAIDTSNYTFTIY